MGKNSYEQPLQDQTKPGSLIQTPAQVSPKPISTLSDNPLLLLVTGPMPADDMVDLCNRLMPDVPQADHVQMLENLDNQYNEGKPVLVPNWWKGSPQAFVQKFNENLTPSNSSTKEPQAERQSRLLEVLLNMLADHLYGQG